MSVAAASDIEELRAEIQALHEVVRASPSWSRRTASSEAASTPKASPAPKAKAKAKAKAKRRRSRCQAEVQSGRQAATGGAKPKPKAE